MRLKLEGIWVKIVLGYKYGDDKEYIYDWFFVIVIIARDEKMGLKFNRMRI